MAVNLVTKVLKQKSLIKTPIIKALICSPNE